MLPICLFYLDIVITVSLQCGCILIDSISGSHPYIHSPQPQVLGN